MRRLQKRYWLHALKINAVPGSNDATKSYKAEGNCLVLQFGQPEEAHKVFIREFKSRRMTAEVMELEEKRAQGFIGRYQERVMELKNNCSLAVQRSI